MRTVSPYKSLALAALSSLVACSSSSSDEGGSSAPPTRPNIVLIVADDFGVDMMPAYAEGVDTACTPFLDGLAADGLLFRNAWVAPQCSPTRAQLLTGRYGFRTGIGTPANAELELDERIVPEMLEGYSSACVGKWHLAGNGGGVTHPNDSGFGRFAGASSNLTDYFNWTKIEDGVESQTSTYATVDTASEAVAAIGTLPEPFFLYVAFHAPHSPAHLPDVALCPDPCANGVNCANVPSTAANWRLTRAMVGAMDTEIGRVLQALDAVDPDAYVVFMGDNGTGAQATRAPFDSNHAKGTMYEGGLNVPLVIKGPGVAAGQECAGLVGGVDLFATMAELAGVTNVTEDSVSLVPYFSDPTRSLRDTVYSELFAPNHQTSLPFTSHERAVRNERYKLIRRTGVADELYDLNDDPWEATDLLPTLVPGSDADIAYGALDAELVRLGVGQ